MAKRLVVAIAGTAAIVAIILAIVLARRASPPAIVPVDAAVQGPARADRCTRGCNSAAACGIATPTCIADCTADPSVLACIELATCSEAAVCGLRVSCNVVADGQGTCRAAMLCQAACAANDLACGCRCAAGIASRNTLALLRVDVCAMHCGFDETCIRNRCAMAIQTCAIQ